MSTHLVWFRNDLRLNDNLALAAACRSPDASVIALYIATPEQWREHGMAPRQAAYIAAQHNALRQSLAEKGIPLAFLEVADFTASVDALKTFCQQQQVTHLFYNYQYEFNERERDAAVERTLLNVSCQGFDDSVILPPGAVMTGNHEMYKVFTPFKRAWLSRLNEGLPECVASPAKRKTPVTGVDCAAITLNYPQQDFDPRLFPKDEKSTLEQLRQFCKQGAGEYDIQRDFPALDGTSRLSAALAMGVLSPRQCLHRLLAEQPETLTGGAGSVWLNELIWREFYRHLMS
jgi:deoxyribodipyrimidine photo-lyase